MIRKARTEDLERISEIYDHIHDLEEEGKIVIGWQRNVYPIRKTAEDSLARGDLFVLEDEDVVVAAAIINRIQVPEYYEVAWMHEAEDEEVMVLHTLVVDPISHKMGYGRSFVEFYERYAAEHNCHELRIDTNARNIIARKMYARMGYKEIAIIPCTFNGIKDVMLVCLEKYLN